LSILLIYIAFLEKYVEGVGMITPTQPMRVALQGKDLRSLYTFYFKVDNTAEAGNYIKIKFSNYASITPKNCMI
jgi:hypothetical protein